ncbi:GNAT family N-acetyltransferase [Jeotgalibacillus sp. R-1-5s-1]|uniref:GNAT family N-acetyltransferase n=1 Tax=Jeotgalibacillus sp. R-1-5s-1 TaxID=2555897 RepID=UPI00106A6055|nr:GNAT family N-acetyltransferase [Jeotgalibacillus sp. R-1-5s-1]TFE03672.1 GNAT family N-acetyltransferase [Jeotgalibacillus sp. R-1-5s-1]
MMKKTFFVFKDSKRIDIHVRNYKEEDFESLIHIQRKAFPPPFPQELLWNRDQLSEHITRFPEGALCIEADGHIAGSITALRTSRTDQDHTWDEITSEGYITNHEPDGDSIYIVDICVDPAYRGLGLGKELMRAMYETVVYLGVKQLAGGSRIPGYIDYQSVMSPEEYFEKVKSGEISDPVVTFLMKSGRVPERLLPGYLEDEESADHAVLMVWKNPFLH